MTDDTPRDGDTALLAELIHALWLRTAPSQEAQRLRGELSTAVDDTRFPTWALDSLPECVWPLIDVAIQRALDARDAALSEARAEVERLRAVAKPDEWRPIETAPRDGTMVWVYTAPIGPPKISGYLAGFQCPCTYHPDAGWCTDELREVTHWVPLECVDLAPPPAASEEGEWRPIETFPYEEEITVDLYGEYRRYADCIWLPEKEAWAVELPTSRGEFIRMENFEPTHWRPVPPPPAVSEEGE